MFFRAKRNFGLTLAGAWLIAVNLLPLINVTGSTITLVLQITGIAAGALLISGR